MNEPINIISLGAGVQSSTMALMAAGGYFQDLNGQVITVDHAIFADTQSEPESVYKWLDYLEREIETKAYAFPIHLVTKGNLEKDESRIRTSKKSGKRYLKGSIPAFTLAPDGKVGLLGRKCTSDYKIIPLQKKVREITGVKRGGKGIVAAKMWIGITTDEAHRMKPSRVDYIENTWPLIDAEMTRTDCLLWMKKHGFREPPRSACYFCPFHGDEEWKMLRDNEPLEFQKAIKFEADIQEAQRNQEVLRGIPFLHSSCKPLSEIIFKDAPEKKQLSLFGNECEGMCGV